MNNRHARHTHGVGLMPYYCYHHINTAGIINSVAEKAQIVIIISPLLFTYGLIHVQLYTVLFGRLLVVTSRSRREVIG